MPELSSLISIARRGTPFTDRAGQACIYLRAWRSSGFDYFPIRSPQFREWFFAEYFSEHETIPTSHAFHALLYHLEAQATSDPQFQRINLYRRIGTRTAAYIPREILLDLANPQREFVEITPTGWKTTTGHAFFRTSRSTDPLPAPNPPRSHPFPVPVGQVTDPPTQQSSTPRSPEPGAPSPNLHSPVPGPESASSLAPVPAGLVTDPPTQQSPNPPSAEPDAPSFNLHSPPTPASEGSLATLRPFLNLASRADWLRCLAWLLSALRPTGPFPPLILQGPPSSGKTLAARALRVLLDPSTANLTPIPSSVRELLTLAGHNWILAFDHISTLSPNLTDALTRLSTTVGVTVREPGMPSSDPIQKSYSRPMLLTVTDRFQCPASLAERALTVTFAPLPPDSRRPEAALGAALAEARPAILAALCDAVSTALRRIPQMTLPTGRSPDALAWAMAAAPALGCTEEEMRQAFNDPPRPDPTVDAVRTLVEQHGPFTGNATDLQHILPASPHYCQPKGLSQQLKKHTLDFADLGIALEFVHKSANSRIISVRYALACPPHSSPTAPQATGTAPLPTQSSDASLPTPPPDASQNPAQPLQPSDKEPLTTLRKQPPSPRTSSPTAPPPPEIARDRRAPTPEGQTSVGPDASSPPFPNSTRNPEPPKPAPLPPIDNARPPSV